MTLLNLSNREVWRIKRLNWKTSTTSRYYRTSRYLWRRFRIISLILKLLFSTTLRSLQMPHMSPQLKPWMSKAACKRLRAIWKCNLRERCEMWRSIVLSSYTLFIFYELPFYHNSPGVVCRYAMVNCFYSVFSERRINYQCFFNTSLIQVRTSNGKENTKKSVINSITGTTAAHSTLLLSFLFSSLIILDGVLVSIYVLR